MHSHPQNMRLWRRLLRGGGGVDIHLPFSQKSVQEHKHFRAIKSKSEPRGCLKVFPFYSPTGMLTDEATRSNGRLTLREAGWWVDMRASWDRNVFANTDIRCVPLKSWDNKLIIEVLKLTKQLNAIHISTYFNIFQHMNKVEGFGYFLILLIIFNYRSHKHVRLLFQISFINKNISILHFNIFLQKQEVIMTNFN